MSSAITPGITGPRRAVLARRIGMATNVSARVQQSEEAGVVPCSALYRILSSGLTYSEVNARPSGNARFAHCPPCRP